MGCQCHVLARQREIPHFPPEEKTRFRVQIQICSATCDVSQGMSELLADKA